MYKHNTAFAERWIEESELMGVCACLCVKAAETLKKISTASQELSVYILKYNVSKSDPSGKLKT